ncbi:MAG: ferritin-like domain-containing protein [Candidatus Diapherotrites archaeon]
MEKKEMLEMFKKDLDIELWLIAFYEEYMERIGEKDVKKTFSKLIEQSEWHATTMRKFIHGLQIELALAERKLSPLELNKLLEDGLKEEVLAEKTYSEQVKNLNDKKYAPTLRKIARQEVQHEKMLREIVKKLSKK